MAEEKKVMEALRDNGYPSGFVHRHSDNRAQRRREDDQRVPRTSLALYVQTNTLGAMLGEEQDVVHRMQLAGLAFHCVGLFAGVGASLELKIRVWNALVRPVLLYVCGTWGLTVSLTEKLCAFHHRHLRVLAGYHWPNHISNDALYKLTKTNPLSVNGTTTS